MKKILLIEDDPHVCSFINKGLTEEGFVVSVAMTGETGLEMFQSFKYDLIILDIMLPNMSGIDVCKNIRNTKSEIPILFLTALGSSENIVMGLNTGADDYLVKPFKFIELVARVKTLLRRSEKFNNDPIDKEILRFADIELDNYSKTVKRDDQEISLTSTEFRLLYLFLKNPRRVLSRATMLDEVWGVNFDLGTNVVDVYVNYLRKKLDKYGKGKLIHTVIGMGYVLKDDEDAA